MAGHGFSLVLLFAGPGYFLAAGHGLLKSCVMAETENLGKGDVRVILPALSLPGRVRRSENEFMQLVDRFGTVEEVFHALRDAMTEATMSVRVPEPGTTAKGWTYASRPDHALRIAAARTMAQILGLIKSGAEVTVNNDNRSLSLGSGDSLAQLAAVGVPRETVEAACRDLLASVSVSEEQAKDQAKSG